MPYLNKHNKKTNKNKHNKKRSENTKTLEQKNNVPSLNYYPYGDENVDDDSDYDSDYDDEYEIDEGYSSITMKEHLECSELIDFIRKSCFSPLKTSGKELEEKMKVAVQEFIDKNTNTNNDKKDLIMNFFSKACFNDGEYTFFVYHEVQDFVGEFRSQISVSLLGNDTLKFKLVQ